MKTKIKKPKMTNVQLLAMWWNLHGVKKAKLEHKMAKRVRIAKNLKTIRAK